MKKQHLLPKRRTLQAAALSALCALVVPLAHSQDFTPHNYWGLGVGQARVDGDTGGLGRVLPPGVSASGFSGKDEDTAYKLFGGRQFNRHLGLEGGYFNLGKPGFSGTTTPAGTIAGSTRVQGVNLDLVGTLPITQRLSVQGRVGAQYARSKGSYSSSGAAAGAGTSDSRSGTGAKMGLGMQYEITPAMWIRGDIERYRVKPVAGGDRNIDVVSVSLVFPFGRAAPTRMAAAAMAAPTPTPMQAPAPQVQARAPVMPPPAPVDVPAAAPRRVSFAAETLFGFDAVALRPEARGALDEFGRELNGTQYESIRIEGHTDRMGDSGYNQALSTRRAEMVRDYMVTSGKIDPARINAQGMGEAQPVTASGACPDRLSRSARIACLQPDRRVDVEVNGTRR